MASSIETLDETHRCREPSEDSERFTAFRSAVRHAGLLNRPGDLDPADCSFGISDDTTLLRFLQARKGNAQHAVSQLREANNIRSVNRVHEFYDELDVNMYEETKTLYPHWTGRLCKKGQPIYIFDASVLSAATMKTYMESCARLDVRGPANDRVDDKMSIAMLRSFAVFDHLTRFILPLCTFTRQMTQDGSPVSKMIMIVDMAGMAWSQVWSLKSYLQDFFKILSTSFPEILDKVFITGTSWTFPAIWNFVKRLADPETTAKFSILRPHEVLSTLQTYMDVENIPRKYGGQLDHHHDMPPLLDEKVKGALAWTEKYDGVLPDGPLKWTQTHGGLEDAIASGTQNLELRMFRFASRRCLEGLERVPK